MERPVGAAGSRWEVMASLLRQGRGDGDRSESKSNPAADTFERPQTAKLARQITFLPKGSATPSEACEVRLLSSWGNPEVEPVIPQKRVEDVLALETSERPLADLEPKCAKFDPLGLHESTNKKVPAKVEAKAVVRRYKLVETFLQETAEECKL